MGLASWTITSVSSSEANGVLIVKLSSNSGDLTFIRVLSLMIRDRCGLVTPKSYGTVSFCAASAADLRGCRPALCGTMLISGTKRFPRLPGVPSTEFCSLRDASCGLLNLAGDELENALARFDSGRQ